jgi:predicted unusual protein kinase regulating ubiquinone biosynthesis (AarF/ABC1/UbiB family)
VKDKPKGPIPLTKMARAGVAGRLVVGTALRSLRLGKSNPEEEWKRRGETLFAACAQLKGLPLKLAQMLSQEEESLPEEFRKELSKSCYQSPPLNRALVRRTIEANLGGSPEKLFASFTEIPFAAASLGQVHLAVTHKGERLALKLQYPGIAQTVKNDLALVGGFAKALPWFKEVQGAWGEVAERMQEELSYKNEAYWTKWFGERLQLTGVTVPKVHENFSTDTLLAMDWMEGIHLNEWMASGPSQKSRDALAASLWRIYLRSVYELGALNADPNPGNFLIGTDGAIVLLDFGCVKSVPVGFSGNLRKMFMLHARGIPSKVSLVDEYQALGILKVIKKNQDFTQLEVQLRSMGDWVLRPYRMKGFDFGASRGYFEACRSEAWQLFRSVNGVAFSPDFVFLDRARYGLYRIFQKLGARVTMANSLEGFV